MKHTYHTRWHNCYFISPFWGGGGGGGGGGGVGIGLVEAQGLVMKKDIILYIHIPEIASGTVSGTNYLILF